MRVCLGGWTAGSLLFALCSSVASADPITITTHDRFAVAAALVFESPGVVATRAADQQTHGDSLAASAQASHGGTAAQAQSRLISSMSADLRHLSGNGTASAAVEGPMGRAHAATLLELDFALGQAHAYAFAAQFASSGGGSWQTFLTQLGGPIGPPVQFWISDMGADQQVRFRGMLEPGRYILHVRSEVQVLPLFGTLPEGDSAFDFTLDLSPAPVPEPGSLMLIGTGVAGLVARVRRRRRSSPACRPAA